jgi:hypothetical protein
MGRLLKKGGEMRLKELSANDEFILVRSGAHYRVRHDQSGASHYNVYCTRIVSGKPFAKIYLNNQCLVDLVKPSKSQESK